MHMGGKLNIKKTQFPGQICVVGGNLSNLKGLTAQIFERPSQQLEALAQLCLSFDTRQSKL